MLVLLFDILTYKLRRSLIMGINYDVSFCFRSPDISSMHHDVSSDLKVVATKLKENLGVTLLYLLIFINGLFCPLLSFFLSFSYFSFSAFQDKSTL